MNLSIIIPVYNEQKSLKELNSKLLEILEKLKSEYEIIYIDDGSTDNSAKILDEISGLSSSIKIINLSRNYGQTQAIAAGIDHSSGEIIVIMDADLQNDPRDIPKILKKLDEGYDVVSGWRKNRKDSLFFKKVPSIAANYLSVFITDVKIHDLGCALKAYRRNVLKSIEFHGEIHRILPLYAAMYGAKITEIPVNHHSRKHGKSKYGLSRFFKLILDMFAMMFMWRFLSKPIYAFGGMGIASLSISVLTGFFIVIRKVFFGGVWVSPLLFIFTILFVTGIQLMLMGIIAEFIIRLYYGVKKEKRYKIKGKE